MKNECKQQTEGKNRESERGAALVTVLMVSFLLMVAGTALILAASMNTANVTDSVAEQQAYYAAESGIQSALNVLRNDRDSTSDVKPNPLVDTNKSENDPANVIDYRKATQISVSNNPNDNSTFARLSRWLDYNTAGSPTRVSVGTNTGQAFSLNVIDPDNTSGNISYLISAYKINGVAAPFHYPSAASLNKFIITYTAPTAAQTTNLNVSNGAQAANFGSFTISVVGAGATIPNNSNVLRAGFSFEIVYQMTSPYQAKRVIRGTITPIPEGSGSGLINSTTVSSVKYKFDSAIYELMGSRMTINNGNNIINPNPPSVNGGVNLITGSVTAAEPQRLLVISTGYGPRGAKKQLEAIVQKNFFNGLSAPATLTLIGPAAGAVYKPGNSNASTMSGDDVVSNINLPPVGVSDSSLLPTVFNEHDDGKPNMVGKPADVNAEMPDWLASATNLNETVEALKRVAISSNRCFNTIPVSTAHPGISGCTNTNPRNVEDYTVGVYATGSGITFVNGDADFGPITGGGILIVTGKLTFRGGFDFRGLIIVTGADGLERSGGGNGNLEGNIVVAPYNPSNLAAGFLPPKYDTSGNGSSEIRYNSSSVNNGLLAVSNFILGVAEK